MKLNIGSGYNCIPGFHRLDIDKRCNPDIVADITDLSKIKSDTIDEIYTAHTLEHILLTHLFKTVRGFCRILKPGGKITVIVPDSKSVAQDWIGNKVAGREFERIALGATPGATEYMFHQQLFWKEKLERYLMIAGFEAVRSKNIRSSYELKATAFKSLKLKG